MSFLLIIFPLCGSSDQQQQQEQQQICDGFKEEEDSVAARDSDPLMSDSEELLLHDSSEAAASSSPPAPRREERAAEPSRPPAAMLGTNVTSVIHSPPAAPKPKLWSLAEIATSSDRCRGAGGESQLAAPTHSSVLAANHPPSPARSSPHCPLSSATVLSRPLYYTSPFYPAYTNYGGPPVASAAHFNGLKQTVLNRAEVLVRDGSGLRARGHTQLELCKDYEVKKGMSNI